MSKNKFTNPWWRRSFRSFSIQQRLPLLICILLLSVVVAFSWASYIGVKRASLAIAGDRLRSLTEQLSSIFAQSLKAGATATRSIASQPAVREYLQSGGKGTDTAALSALQK